MPQNTNQTILILCENDRTWKAIRGALSHALATAELSRTFEIKSLVNACREKKPSFVILDWNAYDPGEIAGTLQNLRATADTTHCPIVFLMTSTSDVQSMAMATEYDIRGIVSLSELQKSIASLAKSVLSEVARPDPMQALLAKIGRARATNSAGELDIAVLDLFALYPKDVNAQVEYANYCMRYGDWKKAKDIIDAMPKITDKNPRVLNIRARLLLKEKRYEEAARVIGQAELMSPQNASRIALLGDVFLAKGKKEEARKKYQSALSILENCHDAKRSLAQLDISEGLVNDALTVLRDSSTEEEMGSFFNDLAIVAVHEARRADAHALYATALTVLQKAKLRARIHFNIAIAHYKENNVAGAIAEFELAHQDDPSFERAAQAKVLFGALAGQQPPPNWTMANAPIEVALRDADEEDIVIGSAEADVNEFLDPSKNETISKNGLSELAQFGANGEKAKGK